MDYEKRVDHLYEGLEKLNIVHGAFCRMFETNDLARVFDALEGRVKVKPAYLAKLKKIHGRMVKRRQDSPNDITPEEWAFIDGMIKWTPDLGLLRERMRGKRPKEEEKP